ncbi:hypothetical protein N3K66_003183 [Trichothecium roseum]|uniref:Uncharacterized protein n=1 Tax=Trichothecium roseum TaxID=47278 RepID=A0ACC0V4R2_9HYPO|nr:hypothetical protein N3K66_003183 [Trichothecium roseum]
MDIKERLAVPGAKTASFLELIKWVDNVPLDFASNHEPYYRLFFQPDPRPHGYIHPGTVKSMPWTPVFTVDHPSRAVRLAPKPSDQPASAGDNGDGDVGADAVWVTSSLQACVDAAISADIFPVLNRMHSEPFLLMGVRPSSATTTTAGEPAAPGASPPPPPPQLERFAASLFGIATRGSHMTAYVRPSPHCPARDLLIWCARRSRHLYSYPGKLDSTVAGGAKSTQTPTQCIAAEAAEEASLPAPLVAERCRPAGVLTLANANPRTGGFHSEVLYCYDMELPAGVRPAPGDDEVEEFVLMTCPDVVAAMLRGEFKTNVCAVLVDFFVRHGVVTPESEGEGEYAAICARLHRQLPVPLAPL